MNAATTFEACKALPALPAADLEIAKDFARASKAAATRRAYQKDFARFTAWCDHRRLSVIPAAPETVAAFLAAEAARGIKPATIGRRVAAIRYAHKLAGRDDPPTSSEVVKATVQGIRRTLGAAPVRKTPATADKVAAMAALADADMADNDFHYSRCCSRAATVRRSKTDQGRLRGVGKFCDQPLAPRNAEDKGKVEASRRWGGFDTRQDVNTDILAQGIAAEIEKLTGKKPYLVMAKFERKYIDANRPPEIALDDPKARPYYDYYHNSVRSFVDDVRGKYTAGLLIEVHGQGKDREVLIRGTRNGRTVAQLLERAGVPAVTGSNGVFGQLEANGFKVFPGNDVPPAGTSENAGYNGGYTVSIYGSHIANGIDAVQLEFGGKYLLKVVLDKSARNAAMAIVAFREAYLKDAAIK